MFRGAAKVTLDAKGRMVIPTRYRDVALERSEGKLVATVDRDQCLLLYPLPDWEQIERKLMSLPSLHADSTRPNPWPTRREADLDPAAGLRELEHRSPELVPVLTARATVRLDPREAEAKQRRWERTALEAAATEDCREGVRAFAEKRKPVFRNR